MDRNDNENIIYIFENLVRICLMLFFLSGRFFFIFENVFQNNVFEKLRKMKIFYILDFWLKSKIYWQNGQSLCYLICKFRYCFVMGVGGGDGGIILFIIFFKGRVFKFLQFFELGYYMYQGIICIWQILILLRCMVLYYLLNYYCIYFNVFVKEAVYIYVLCGYLF